MEPEGGREVGGGEGLEGRVMVKTSKVESASESPQNPAI